MAEKKVADITTSHHHEVSPLPKPMLTTNEPINLREGIKGNASVLWWCLFFALSAIGWYDQFTLNNKNKC